MWILQILLSFFTVTSEVTTCDGIEMRVVVAIIIIIIIIIICGDLECYLRQSQW